MNSWRSKQRFHLKHFEESSREIEEDWYRTYEPITPLIHHHGMDISVADIGCGAMPYSLEFPFREVVLVDTLLAEYRKLPWSTVDGTPKHVAYPIEVVQFHPQPDAVFLFNVLDHMPHNAAVSALEKAALANKYVAGYVDYRKKPDKRHYVWSEGLDDYFPAFKRLAWIPCSRPGVEGKLFFYERQE